MEIEYWPRVAKFIKLPNTAAKKGEEKDQERTEQE